LTLSTVLAVVLNQVLRVQKMVPAKTEAQ